MKRFVEKCGQVPSLNIVKITAKYCIVDTGYWFVPGLLLKMTDKLAVTADTLRPRFLPPAAAARRIINELSFCLLVMLEAAASFHRHRSGPTIGRGAKSLGFLCLVRNRDQPHGPAS